MNLDLLVPSIIEGYKSYLIQKNIKATNIVKYITIIRKFHNYIGKPYIDADYDDIQSYFDFLAGKKHLKFCTLSRYLAVLKQFYKYLIARGVIYINPCVDIKLNLIKIK